MRIVIDINHPAHVHFFKYFIWEMKRKGHEVLITATNKDNSLKLLDRYNFNYINLGSYGNTIYEKLLNIPVSDVKMYNAVKKFNPDIFLGLGSIRAPHVSFLLGKRSINYEDTEHSMEQIRLYAPFVNTICTPSSFKLNLGNKQIRCNSFKELSYLHPDRFKPNPGVLDELGLSKDDNIFFLRLAAFNASHDSNSNGFKRELIPSLINKLEKYGNIIISSEVKYKGIEKYQYKLSPEKYHDLLYYSKLYIGEGSTSAVEAAILGTPSLHFERLNIGGKVCGITSYIGVLDELQNKYGLLYSYYDEEKLLIKLDEILSNVNTVKDEWKKKKEQLLTDKVDIVKFMIELVENYPKDAKQINQFNNK